MAKYDVDSKLGVVQKYLSSSNGVRELAQRYGVGRSLIRRRIASYRQHGRSALEEKYTRYGACFKPSVLVRMRDEGMPYGQVAATFDIRNPDCVADWSHRYADG